MCQGVRVQCVGMSAVFGQYCCVSARGAGAAETSKRTANGAA